MIFAMCWKCGKNIGDSLQIFRTTVCPDCGADVHSCRNCLFYERGAHYDCKERIDDPVWDKERANFCDWFSARRAVSASAAPDKKAAAARDMFNSLFG